MFGRLLTDNCHKGLRGMGLGQCYIISWEGSAILLYRPNVIWGGRVSKWSFLCYIIICGRPVNSKFTCRQDRPNGRRRDEYWVRYTGSIAAINEQTTITVASVQSAYRDKQPSSGQFIRGRIAFITDVITVCAAAAAGRHIDAVMSSDQYIVPIVSCFHHIITSFETSNHCSCIPNNFESQFA